MVSRRVFWSLLPATNSKVDSWQKRSQYYCEGLFSIMTKKLLVFIWLIQNSLHKHVYNHTVQTKVCTRQQKYEKQTFIFYLLAPSTGKEEDMVGAWYQLTTQFSDHLSTIILFGGVVSGWSHFSNWCQFLQSVKAQFLAFSSTTVLKNRSCQYCVFTEKGITCFLFGCFPHISSFLFVCLFGFVVLF